jgi:hypothetical protein
MSLDNIINYIDIDNNDNDNEWFPNNLENYKKFSQYNNLEVKKEEVKKEEVKKEEVKKEEVKKEEVKKEEVKKDKKIKKILPLNLISTKFNIEDLDYIKNKLKILITNKNSTKVFGQKKSSEILKGITENKWNISLVTFISFLLDIKIIYLKKEILYNKDLPSYETINI